MSFVRKIIEKLFFIYLQVKVIQVTPNEKLHVYKRLHEKLVEKQISSFGDVEAVQVTKIRNLAKNQII